MSLPALLTAYAAGRSHVQQELLDEVEPLLFGYARSLLPGASADPDSAARIAQELTFMFHLRAMRGRIEAQDIGDLRRLCHKFVRTRLDATDPLSAKPLSDPATGSAVERAISLGMNLEFDPNIDDSAIDLLAHRLLGAPLPKAAQTAWQKALPHFRSLEIL